MIDYLVIGNGVAGRKAMETIRRFDTSGTVTVVSEEPHHFYYRPQLPDFIAGKVQERSLFADGQKFYSKNNIDTLFGVRAAKVLPHRNEVMLENGKSLQYRRLLLSPGGRMTQESYPGADNTDDIVGLKTLDDAIAIREKAKDVRQAVVAGDSFIATYLVKALNELGISVTYIIQEDHLFPDAIDSDASALLEMRLKLKGVNLIKSCRIEEIEVRKGSVYGVKITGNQFVECQLIGVADGLAPDIEFVRESGIAAGMGVFVDRCMQTNISGVFAAGDAALLLNSGHDDMPQINIRWLKAWKQGMVAGANMAGHDAVYDDIECFASTQIYDIDMVSMGISNPINGKYRIMRGEYPHPETDVYKKLVLDNGKLVGALLIGSVREGSALMKAIIEEKMVSDIDRTLIKQMFDMNYRLSPYHGIICPVCKLEILLEPNSKEGDLLNCPACGIEIRLTGAMMGS